MFINIFFVAIAQCTQKMCRNYCENLFECSEFVDSFLRESQTISGEIKIAILWCMKFNLPEAAILNSNYLWLNAAKWDGISTKVSCQKLLICGNERVLLTINYLPRWLWYHSMEFRTDHESSTDLLNSIKSVNTKFPKRKKRDWNFCYKKSK